MSSERSDEALVAQQQKLQQQQDPTTQPKTDEPTQDGSPASVRPASPALDVDGSTTLVVPKRLPYEGLAPASTPEQAVPLNPASIPLPTSPLSVSSSPLPADISPASSPLPKPPLAPPPRSRARPSPGPSGLASPASASRRTSVAPIEAAGNSSVAKALDYGDGGSTPPGSASLDPATSQPVKKPADDTEQWSTPALPSFRDTPLSTLNAPVNTIRPSGLPPSTNWVAPHVTPAGPPALPPRSSSLEPRVYSSPGPSPWSSPSRPSPSLPSSSSSFLKPPISPQISDQEATGPLPKRRSSSGVYTPASFPGPSARKGSAPAAVLRPPLLPTTGSLAMYRKASEGAGLGIGLEHGGAPLVPHAPLEAPTSASGRWGLWSSARSYFASPPAMPAASSGTVSPHASSPLAGDPVPSLATALFPAETDTLLPTGSLSPTGVYTPNSFYEQQQQHLRSLGLNAALPTSPTVAGSRSPLISDLGPSHAATAPRTPSSARKPAPAMEPEVSGDQTTSVNLALPAGGLMRKAVPLYSPDQAEYEDAPTVKAGVDTTLSVHSPPSSQGPLTPAWEQPETPSLPYDKSRHAEPRTNEGDAGFGGFKGLGKDMAVLEVAQPLEAQEPVPTSRVW